MGKAKVAVVGGAGFIGRRICAVLESRSIPYKVIDSLTGYHLGKLPKDAEFEKELFFQVRSNEYSDYSEFTHIIHLASKQDYSNPSGWPKYVDENCREFSEFLAKLNDSQTLVLFSSQAVYGHSQKTVDSHPKPYNIYGATKLCQETLARSLFSGRLVILRPSVVIGWGQSPKNLYSGLVRNTVCRLARKLQPIVYSDGFQLRDYVDVEDLARCAVDCALGKYDLDVVNCCYPRRVYSALEVVGEITRLMHKKGFEPQTALVDKYERVADCNDRFVVSHCNLPEAFPSDPIYGEALEKHVSYILSMSIPSRTELLQLHEKNLQEGLVKMK